MPEKSFEEKAGKYHVIGAWVALVFNPLFGIGDYFNFQDFWVQFIGIRMLVSCLTLMGIGLYYKNKINPHVLIFIPFIGISLENAYMYSVMDIEALQKHTFAYIALFIGAGMLILWPIRYSVTVVSGNLAAAVLFFYLFSPLKTEEVLVNGGLLTFSVSVFTIVLIQTRYRLTRNEIKARADLEESRQKIEQKNKDITDSIKYAKRIQRSILPDENELKKHFQDSFIFFLPKDIVSGDFYWFDKMGDSFYATVVDCTGHGVPGAFMSLIGNDLLQKIIKEERIVAPEMILNRLRGEVIAALNKPGKDSEMKDGMDMALVEIKLSKGDKFEVRFAGANNPLYVVSEDPPETSSEVCQMKNQNRILSEIKGDKQPIGEFFKSEPFTGYKINLNKGDSLYLFSDGFADQFGGPEPMGKKFKYKPFKELILSVQDEPMELQNKKFQKVFREWKGELDQVDDVCLMGIEL